MMEGPARVSGEELRLAREMRVLRRRIAEAYGVVASCAACVHPRSRVATGGFCCTGRTERLFVDDELAALKLGGTKPSDLKTPRDPQQGCAFLGARGCSLDPVDRPNLCMRYACRELTSEIERRGDGPLVRSLHSQLHIALHRFTVLRRARGIVMQQL
jgi:hypothetical protein